MAEFIQITNNAREKLALLEKDPTFLERNCEEVRRIIAKEIGELLPNCYRFMIWGNPMSKQQESLCKFKKCAVLQSKSSEYPEDMAVYLVHIQETEVPCRSTVPYPGSKEEQPLGNSNSIRAVGDNQKSIQTLMSNLEAEKTALTYRYQVAEATLSSLKEPPKSRMPIGNNLGFTCSKCHCKGHRSSSCRQPPCDGFYECGNVALHKDHRDNLKKAELEVRNVQKMLNDKTTEIKNTAFMMQQSKTNFFSCMRRRLRESNPIKYSNRVELDNDLRILAAATSHKLPAEDADLEEIIFNYKNRASSYHGKEPMSSQTNMFHQVCTTKTIVSSPTMQYTKTLSHYQCSSSPGHSSNDYPSTVPPKRTKLTYTHRSPVKYDKGATFRANLNKQYNIQNDDDDDDETQDVLSATDSPPFTSTPEHKENEIASSLPLHSDSLEDESESQAFHFDSWVAQQQSISKSIN